MRAKPVDAAARTRAQRERALLLAVAALVLAACFPLARVFFGLAFVPAVVGAALVALGVDAGCRRLGAGPGLALVASVLAYIVFVGLVFFPTTLFLGVVPTPAAFAAGRDTFVAGLELVRTAPSPTYAEPELVLLAVTGVWAVAHAVDGLVFRLAAPIAAVVLALVLLCVPLALATPSASAWLWALPFLAASAALLLAYAGSDLVRFGRWVYADDPAGIRAARNPLTTGGGLLATCAIVVGSLVAGLLPGFADRPWYELRGSGGTALTTNPIVGLHSRLVSSNPQPVLRVRTSRPLYLRTTSLDQYDADQEIWTSSGVSGDRVQGLVRLDAPLAVADTVAVALEVLNLPGALLVPMPYQATGVWDSAPGRLRYDSRLSTFYVPENATLQTGDVFEAVASVPSPTAEQLEVVQPGGFDPALTALPELPPEVGALARQIVERDGAATQLQQALAIQNELRRWTYSLEVVPSHRRSAITAFLENRTGYCEQFAATMAIMLRALGIPARVAVGYTPGIPDRPELVGTGQEVTYTVSNANAHAWVEVLFSGYGWIAFEPTPRSDGNVLVPTASNLAPEATATAPQPLVDDNLRFNEVPDPGDLGPGLGAEAPPAAVTPGGAGQAGAPGVPLRLLGLSAALLVLAFATLLAWRVRRNSRQTGLPRDRVLRARTRIRRLGMGLGKAPLPSETDREYLQRLTGGLQPSVATGAATRVEAARDLLARRAGQALWAPALPEGAAEVAEAAAGVLEEALLTGLSWRRRLAVRARMLVRLPSWKLPRRGALADASR